MKRTNQRQEVGTWQAKAPCVSCLHYYSGRWLQRLIIWLWWKVKVSAKFRKEYATREPICASKETETIIFYVLFHSRYRAVSIADRLEPNTFESPNKTRDLKVFLARNVDIIANPRNQKPNSKVISSPIFPIVRRWDFRYRRAYLDCAYTEWKTIQSELVSGGIVINGWSLSLFSFSKQCTTIAYKEETVKAYSEDMHQDEPNRRYCIL